MVSHTTFRLDDSDPDSFLDVLNKYVELHPTARYVINSEISSVRHKEHFQGWITHDETNHSVQQYMSRHFKKYKKHQKSFAKVRKPEIYFSYILNNEQKPNVTLEDVYTNYDEEEFQRFKDLPPFVALASPDKPKGKRCTTKTYQDTVLDTLERKCVKDGLIQYTKIPSVYLSLAPKLQMDKAIARKNATGYTLRLETMYPHPDNRIITEYLYEGICTDDMGKPTPFSHFFKRPDPSLSFLDD